MRFQSIKHVYMLTIILLTVFPIISFINPGWAIPTTSDPYAHWSVDDGETLIGPDAPFSVSWVGGSYDIVNNTLEFVTGEIIIDSQGNFSNIFEENHILQFSVTTSGFYSMILSWNDPVTDLDVVVYDDPTLLPTSSVLNPWWQMSTLAYPERVDGVYLAPGEYWASIDWFSGNTPVEYQFFVGSSNYYYRNYTNSGANMTINTEDVPDENYTVIASCYDSESNFYTDYIMITTRNQYLPVIEWFRFNSFTTNGTRIQQGERLVLQWYATDINSRDAIFSTMYYKEPGDYQYSVLFSSWTEFTYRIYWNNSHFEHLGLYRFKLVVNNINQPPSEAVYFNFYITDGSDIDTNTSIESTKTTNPLLNSANGFSFIILITTFPLMIIITRKHK